MARQSTKRALRPPSRVDAYRVNVSDDDELLLFVWEPAKMPAASLEELSPAEREVLSLVVEGRSNAEIAASRGTALRTVANQVASILQTLGARSRFELIGRHGCSPKPVNGPSPGTRRRTRTSH